VSVVANVAINVDSRNAVTKLRQVQSQSQATERAVNGLGAAVRKLAAAFSAIQAARFVFVQTAELEKQTRSLEVLTGSATKAAQIIKELKDIGAVTPFTSTELIDSAKRLQAFGVETNKVVETTRRLADVSGATGAELQGLVTAYGQVQAKGRLQGEELLQFQERGVALQKVLREEYKLSGEEFQDALSKGRIGAEAVEYAIKKLTDAGGKYANGAIAQSDTLAGRLSTLQDAVQNLAQRLGTILAPAMKSILGLAIDIANQINNVFETILLQRQLGANLAPAMRDRLFKQAGQEALEIAKLRGGRNAGQFGRSGAMIRSEEFQRLREERFRDLMRAYGYEQGILTPPTAAPPAAAATLPGLMAPTAGGSKGRSGVDKAAREAERLAQEIERSLAAGRELGTQFQRQILLMDAATDVEKQRLQIQFDYEDRAKQIAELKNEEQRINLAQLNDEIRRLEIIKLQTEALKKQAKEAEKLFKKALGKAEFGVAGQDTVAGGLTDAISKLKEELNPVKLAIDSIVNGATAIGDAFSTAFGEVITGAKSTQEALADAFKKIGDAFISMAVEIIAKQMTLIILQTILNALSGGSTLGTANKNLSGTGALSPKKLFPGGVFAEGGFVTGPTNALIGEGGESEYVLPSSKMRTAMARYSAGARGPGVIPGNSTEPVAAGGVATMEPIDVRYSVERINSVDYVTADQFQAGMRQAAQQGAQQGERRALTTLRQNTSQRKRIGI